MVRDKHIELLDYRQMIELPEPEWLIEGLIQTRTASLLFGTSNSFKSFLAIDMGLHIASGRKWHGQVTRQGRCLIVATEGANAVGRSRIPAWFDHKDISEEGRENIFLYPGEVRLDLEEDVQGLITALNARGPFDLIVLDIFGACMVGSEIEDKTARIWVSNCQQIIAATGTSLLVVAHTGWSDSTRARMHSHFWGSFDTRLKVEGDKRNLTAAITVDRHKDADSSGKWNFRLVQSVDSLVPILDQTVVVASRRKLSKQQSVALNALDDAIEERGECLKGENWPPCKVVAIVHWKARCRRHKLSVSGTPAAERKAFSRVLKSLREAGFIYILDERVWRCTETVGHGTKRDKLQNVPAVQFDK